MLIVFDPDDENDDENENADDGCESGDTRRLSIRLSTRLVSSRLVDGARVTPIDRASFTESVRPSVSRWTLFARAALTKCD